MTTFQAIVHAILYGFTQFLPVSADAHQAFLPFVLGWAAPSEAFLGALNFSGFLALFIYFRHDLASLISNILQVVIYRKPPMTMDERLPVFIIVGIFPLAVAWYYLQGWIAAISWTPVLYAIIFFLCSLPIWLADYYSRKNKTMSDWNWLDATIVGILQILMLLPGAGVQCGSLSGGLFRNYNREAAAKFSFFLLLPVLGVMGVTELRALDFHADQAAPETSWLSFWAASVVCFLTSLLVIGGFMKNVQKKGFGQYVIYRFLLAAGVIGLYWYRSRSGA